jgi:hypothetical protein
MAHHMGQIKKYERSPALAPLHGKEIEHHKNQFEAHKQQHNALAQHAPAAPKAEPEVHDLSHMFHASVKALEKRLGAEFGPRGGHIIGKTKSGKPIYETFEHPAHKAFSDNDHHDAASLHERMAVSALGKNRGAAFHHAQQMKKHAEQFYHGGGQPEAPARKEEITH